MKVSDKSYPTVIVIAGILFFVLLIILEQKNYRNKEYWHFTRSFYQSAISGRIKTISNNKQSVTLRLTPLDSLYTFIPLPVTTPKTIHFLGIARTGDSVWKFPNSDTIYILSKNGSVYSWKFETWNK